VAWRIESSVVRGELDNRVRGQVRGRLWLHGVAEPFIVELTGNAAPDFAGCLLEFENLDSTHPLPRDVKLAPPLIGVAGELTASRRVCLADYDERGRPKPADRWGNAVYLEWFSPSLGRVVIESADFRVRVSAPEWSLTPAEDAARREGSEQAFLGFLGQLDDALSRAESNTPPAEKPDWDEFDYENLLRESDARADKYSELLDRYMDHPDRDEIVDRLMGWSEDDDEADADMPDGGGEADDGPPTAEELNAETAAAREDLPQPDPATEGVDWIREPDGNLTHPLSLRAFNSSMELWRATKEAGLERSGDEDVGELIAEFQVTTAKLSGALDSLAFGRNLECGAFIVAYLKRALSHLHRAQCALERVAPRDKLPVAAMDRARTELFGIREEILRLMQEFRGQSE
jgi:hypothetical protein